MRRVYEAASKLKGVEGQTNLATLLNESPQTINNWESRGISKNGLLKVQELVGCNAQWVQTGSGSMELSFAESLVIGYKNNNPSNTELGPHIRGNVPIISWVQAGQWHEAMDFESLDDIKYLPCPKSHSDLTYALRVRGDSMTASYGKSYPENCIIFVDPELRNPTSGDRIIAKINGDAEVTFKVFMQEGEKKWLKPLNPQHPIITDEFKVLGKIIGKWEDE